ncbi:Helix-turn-helix domain protein [compost metagenome]
MTYYPGRCRLRQILKEQRKTQKWLSEKTGIDKYRISYYSNDRGFMHLSTAKTIAAALNCSIDDLYDWIYVGGGLE